jgi:hypothetical protein
MIRLQTRKTKFSQYFAGGAIAVIVLILWVSLPLMNNSSLDSSVSAGNPFRSRITDIGVLSGDIPSEGGAPGSPLSGEMTDNPATSGDILASSLFQSGTDFEDASAEDKASADAGAPSAPDKYSASAPPPSRGAGGAKLAPLPSITAGNSNSMSTGGTHNKFFGTGNAKADFAPVGDFKTKNVPDADRKSALVAMLSDAADKSKLAAKTGSMDAAKGGSAAAFEKIGRGDAGNLTTDLEKGAASSGLSMGQAAQDLKRNDPSLSSHKVQMPEPKPTKTDDSEEEMKKMIMQMIIQATLGSMFGAMGQVMATAINPNFNADAASRPMGVGAAAKAGAK